ncbi:hypothetical protein L798_05135 [Zootermopsis nevadensis]|uniref:Uncharacterized protein n=1 Tax=Zootermopsis nevadensis TaxID=136037 RepID=A0A067R805_ZOONE|nr:hypothetical protein L798_05135 [Zootermopsis nevadensis]
MVSQPIRLQFQHLPPLKLRLISSSVIFTEFNYIFPPKHVLQDFSDSRKFCTSRKQWDTENLFFREETAGICMNHEPRVIYLGGSFTRAGYTGWLKSDIDL